MEENKGTFTISLDLELHWGVCSRLSVDAYRKNLDGTRVAIQQMLSLFDEFNIHATWATVGFLFCKTFQEMELCSPLKKPVFKKPFYSSYNYFESIGENELEDPYHFGNSIINEIKKYKSQEIATHTWSHLFCLEEEVKLIDVENDLISAIHIARHHNVQLDSIVFPRNQYNSETLKALCKVGIKYFRGVTPGRLYSSRKREDENILIRILRFIDAYINLSGANAVNIQKNDGGIVNIPGSRFLRPYSKRLRYLDGLKLHRICSEMTYAAKNGKVYHLWWHPHNFGIYTTENILFLRKILEHYKFLQKKYGMISKSMNEY